MTQSFRGMEPSAPRVCVDCHRAIGRGVRCFRCPMPVHGDASNRAFVRLMKLNPAQRIYLVFQASALAGIWRWIAGRPHIGPPVGYYVDRRDEPGTRRLGRRRERRTPHPHRLTGPPAVCPHCHTIEDCRTGHCPQTNWKGCHD